jgi:8-oxo-dGTP pyrophosphatase MutT (NUDIX family)
LAGGAIEQDEDFESAILRELEEETHLEQKSIKLLGKPENMAVSYNYGEPIRNIVLFKAEYLTPLLPVDISVIDGPYDQPEHYEFRWVGSYEEIKYLQFGSDDIKKIFKQTLPR